ncbi:uncharacterized protein Z518_06241 [Rhinocladiella mackenziei CBS 650.93]|uniref:AAA-ATPase-like domain-containing protein n=1 Tax=Rhinocladiella mackenziei CBS 650.93 TaxID=1442369 RepID=A0A0D2IHX1_9EURO|nr:uncharacterized protein Z518_06241 [Rhinocladiella mackenziei CBS 650.93]KIX05369.1 hypothetical protein Z518_06241 [Rhinocladiella mackenziei CBS 650.93]
MDDPKQASHSKLAIDEINEWDADDLLKWIDQERPGLLKGEGLERFKTANINKNIFVNSAGDMGFFRNECELSVGISKSLAMLASEVAKGKTTGPETRKRKHTPEMAPSPKRTRVDNGSLIINGELEYFRSGAKDFPNLLQREGQAYFDRTGYISKLGKLDEFILFCRPRRFGKTLTIRMLEHFHGLQYADEHRWLYKGLDVQKDIDERKVSPGKYFVLTFDFSEVNASPDLTEANKALMTSLNGAIKDFYNQYAVYLGGNFTDLCQHIDSENPNSSLKNCAMVVRNAIEQDDRLAGIERIYVLVDEYDAFPNNYIKPPKTARETGVDWDDTQVGRTFKSFWSMMKRLCARGDIRRIFITGISPLSLSSLGSAFNVTKNVSFNKNLAGLCGLTYSDLEDALKGIYEDPEVYNGFLSEMTKFFNGYHFCKDKTVETVYNTETCLAYLQCRIDGDTPETRDPENSEVSEQFLNRFAASTPVIRDFEKALECDGKGNFMPVEYDRFRPEFTLRDLNEDEDYSSWRSLTIYFGGLTFHPEKPTTHLKIPNRVAADRIALAVLRKYGLCNSLSEALRYLVDYGELEQTLGCYRELMMQRDVTTQDLTQTNEAAHRDSFYFSLLQNHFLAPRAEFKVIKPNKTNGRIDLILQVPGQLIVTEWKFYRINFLDIEGVDRYATLAKADILRNYDLSKILELKFATWDIHHQGTIGSWVMANEARQLRDYIKSTEIQQKVEKDSLELQAHFVIVVGSRHILLWDMDKEGNLAAEPRLVQAPSRSKRTG